MIRYRSVVALVVLKSFFVVSNVQAFAPVYPAAKVKPVMVPSVAEIEWNLQKAVRSMQKRVGELPVWKSALPTQLNLELPEEEPVLLAADTASPDFRLPRFGVAQRILEEAPVLIAHNQVQPATQVAQAEVITDQERLRALNEIIDREIKNPGTTPEERMQSNDRLRRAIEARDALLKVMQTPASQPQQGPQPGTLTPQTAAPAPQALPVPVAAQQTSAGQPQPTVEEPQSRVFEFDEYQFTIYGPAANEKSRLTPQQMELALAQLASRAARSGYINGITFDEFMRQYGQLKNRTDQEALIMKYHKGVASLPSEAVEFRKEDVEFLNREEFMARRNPTPTRVREWGVVEETRMGPTINCDQPLEMVKNRQLMFRALVDRMTDIPNFDFARQAALLRAFDRTMREGPDGYHAWVQLEVETPFNDWAVGGRRAAYNKYYEPEPGNERAMSAKSINLFLPEFGEVYAAGCACGGNWAKRATKIQPAFKTEGVAPVCKGVEGQPAIFTSNEQVGQYHPIFDINVETRNSRWTLGASTLPDTTLEARVSGKQLDLGTSRLTYSGEARDRARPESPFYPVSCFIDLEKRLPQVECKSASWTQSGMDVTVTVDYVDETNRVRRFRAVSGNLILGEGEQPNFTFNVGKLPPGEYRPVVQGLDSRGNIVFTCPGDMNIPPIIVPKPCPGNCFISGPDKVKMGEAATFSIRVPNGEGEVNYTVTVTNGKGVIAEYRRTDLVNDQVTIQPSEPGKYRIRVKGVTVMPDGRRCEWSCERERGLEISGPRKRIWPWLLAAGAAIGLALAFRGGGKSPSKPAIPNVEVGSRPGAGF